MSDKEEQPKDKRIPTKEEKERAKEAKLKAKSALEQRSKRSNDTIYYWMVIGGFVVMCIAFAVYVFREWRESPNLVPAINDADISRHNSAKGVPFLRGPNSLFAVC
jgi:hypothetical protein